MNQDINTKSYTVVRSTDDDVVVEVYRVPFGEEGADKELARVLKHEKENVLAIFDGEHINSRYRIFE